MAQVEKWMGPARERMERKGTAGSLREIARRRGMLAGKKENLTCGDIASLKASAKRSGDTKLMRKATMAGNMMKCK